MSLIEDLAQLPPDEAQKVLAGLTPQELEALNYDWKSHARPEQLAPTAAQDGEPWDNWLILAGRGFGKTRSGAEFIRSEVCGDTPLAKGAEGSGAVAIIGETAKDLRDVVVEGPSGILAVHPKGFRPEYEPSKNRLTWPNGTIATLYNGTEPDQLRGPQFGLAWADELAKWRYADETWDMLQFGLRIGTHPRSVVTTTPRPIKLLKQLIADPRSAVTRGNTYDNAENLADAFLRKMRAKYEGTRLGRQELRAELLEDDPNALWRRSIIDDHRCKPGEIPPMQRIVVSVDIAAKATANQRAEGGAETGITVAGLGTNQRGYVLSDDTCEGGPNEWSRRVVAAFDLWEADCVIVETNNGGDMIAAILRSTRDTLPIKEVTASRGKITRAEPVAALYEQGRVSHVGSFAALEDQMVSFNNIDPDNDNDRKDRVDSLVWGMTDLFPRIIERKKEKWSDRWSGRGTKAWRRRRS
jgi:phage terminase large subunit-like protein